MYASGSGWRAAVKFRADYRTYANEQCVDRFTLFPGGEELGTAMQYAYDGDRMLIHYTMSNGVYRRYVYGPGVDEPIVFYKSSQSLAVGRTFIMADERGSVISTANSAGVTQGLAAYDEYGIPSALIAAQGYTGQVWLQGFNMWYYKARVYSPSLGRFMQTDPIGYGDGMNWYGYVKADPVNRSDPSGLFGCSTFDNYGPAATYATGPNLSVIVPSNRQAITGTTTLCSDFSVFSYNHDGQLFFEENSSDGLSHVGRQRIPSPGEAEENRRNQEQQNCSDAGIGRLVRQNGAISRALLQIQANHGRTGNEWGFVANSRGQIVAGVSEGTSGNYTTPLSVRIQQLFHMGGDLIVFHSHTNPGLSEVDRRLGDQATTTWGFGEPISVAVNRGELFCSRPAH